MRFRIHEGEFQLPDSLHDQTVNVFTATPSGASPFNIVITRSVPQTAQLDDHVRSELAVMKQAIVGFELLWERRHQMGNRPATIVASRIGAKDGPMDQRQLFCLFDEKKALTVTATAAPAFDRQQLDWLNELVSSFTFADTA